MSVVIETTLGDITVDLFLSERPRACLNFLKLCKIKYYNYNLFHTITRGFIAQTGDPTGTRNGGESVYGVLDGPLKRFFEGENEPRIKHTKMGLISFVGNEKRLIGSQFFLTLGADLSYLDDKHCVFGEVVEGFEILEGINEVICDSHDRPYQDVRITHTVVLDDPYPNPKRLVVPSRSPSPSAERLQGGRIAPDEEIDEKDGKTSEEIAEMQAAREAKARATILEMVGDLPDADMAPPENVLFVCKLNPVTSDDDLEIIFSRFGKIKSCEVIRDKKTGDSLQYAFVEFEEQKSCEDAYFKMDNVLIDDRRIHVDFSQSVSKVKWLGKGRGVAHFDDKGRKKKGNDTGNGDYKNKENIKRDNNKFARYKDKARTPPMQRERSPKNDKSRSNRERSFSPKTEKYRAYEDGRKGSLERQKKRSISSKRNIDFSTPPRRKGKKSPQRDNRENMTFERDAMYSNKSRNQSASPRRNKDIRSPKRNRYKSPKRSSHDRTSRSSRNEKDPSGSSRYKSRSPKTPKRKTPLRHSETFSRGNTSCSRDRSSSRGKYENNGGRNRAKFESPKRSRNKTEDKKSSSSTSKFDKSAENKFIERKDNSRTRHKSRGKPKSSTESSDSDSEFETKKSKLKKMKKRDSDSEVHSNKVVKKKKKRRRESSSSSSDSTDSKEEQRKKIKKKKSGKKFKQDSSSSESDTDSDNYRKRKSKKKKYSSDSS